MKKCAKRAGDYVARYGGEEFSIIQINSENSAWALAEQCRLEIEKTILSFENYDQIKITISIGIASIEPNQKDSYKDLINTADEALYEAKARGRNLVVAKDIKKTHENNNNSNLINFSNNQ